MSRRQKDEWPGLEPYRETVLKGEWPTIPELLQLAIDRFPSNQYLVARPPQSFVWTFQETHQIARRIASALSEVKIGKGDRVLLMGGNSPYWVVAFLGIVMVGAVVVPLDVQTPLNVIEHVTGFTGAKAAFLDPDRGGRLKGVREFFLSDNLMRLSEASRSLPEGPVEGDLAAILFTSGTTGREKGVMLSHRNIISNLFQGTHPSVMTLRESDVFYGLLPLYHIYPLSTVLLGALKEGCSIVFPHRISVSDTLKDLKEAKVTALMGVPLLFNKIHRGIMQGIRKKGILIFLLVRFLMKVSQAVRFLFRRNPGPVLFGGILKKASLGSLRFVSSGGASISPKIVQEFTQLGIHFIQGYGLTEASPLLAIMNPAHQYRPASVGKILPFIETKIVKPDAEGVGELAVRGSNICLGYYRNPQATQKLFDEEGFLLTGDKGRLSKGGHLYLSGRSKTMIVTEGGKNIFPEELEDLLQKIPSVEQVMIRQCILNGRTKSRGLEVLFYPVWEQLKQYSQRQVVQMFVKEVLSINRRLPFYKRISKGKVLKDPMPMTTTRKIQRHKVETLLLSPGEGWVLPL